MLRGAPQAQVALLEVRIVPLAGERVRVRRPVHHLSYFRVLVADVVREFRLLESGRRHALVPGSGSGRWVRGVQARLDQRLARLARDHRLELAGSKRVHVAGLGCHQEHHLGAGQCREFVRLQQNEKLISYAVVELQQLVLYRVILVSMRKLTPTLAHVVSFKCDRFSCF